MKRLLTIAGLASAFFASSQTYKDWTIDNQTKTVVTVSKDTLSLTNVPTYAIIHLTQRVMTDTASADSLVIVVKSLGKKLFTAQVRLSPDSSLIRGKAIPVASDSLGISRLVVPVKSFSVPQFRSVRLYITSGDKDGFLITDISFKKSYVPPVVVLPPVIAPGAPGPLRIDSLYIEAQAGYEFLYIKGAKGVDTLRQIRRKQ